MFSSELRMQIPVNLYGFGKFPKPCIYTVAEVSENGREM